MLYKNLFIPKPTETTNAIYSRKCHIRVCFRNLLLGLACNEFTKEMCLDISNNGLGSQGAHVLESCVHGVRCISSLDISDNSNFVQTLIFLSVK